MSFLLSLEVLEHVIERVEALVPRTFVTFHPIVDFFQRPAVQSIDALPPFAS
jgi:hypothetical protein